MPQPRPARRRRAAQPERGDRRRPGADGRQLPLHRGHRHRRVHDAAHRLQPARRARTSARAGRVQLQHAEGMCPACEGLGRVVRRRRRRAGRPSSSRSTRARSPCPNFGVDTWYWQIIVGSGLLRPGRQAPGLHPAAVGGLPAQAGHQDQGRRRSTPPTRGWWSRSGGSTWPRTASRCSRTSARSSTGRSTFASCPACGGARLNEAALVVEDRRPHHRRVRGHADQRPGRVRPRHRRRRRSRRCSPTCATRWTRWSRSAWATSAWTASPAPCPAARRSG